jgi:hypothetical protein
MLEGFDRRRDHATPVNHHKIKDYGDYRGVPAPMRFTFARLVYFNI